MKDTEKNEPEQTEKTELETLKERIKDLENRLNELKHTAFAKIESYDIQDYQGKDWYETNEFYDANKDVYFVPLIRIEIE